MPKIVTTAEMRTIEAAADEGGQSYAAMMDMAGAAVAERILSTSPALMRIVVLVGPGNNGGDGLVAASYVKRIRPVAEVSAYLLIGRDEQDEVFAQARAAGVFIAEAEHDTQNRVLKNLVAGADIIVDALLGTGTQLPLRDNVAKLLSSVHSILIKRAEAQPKPRSSAVTQYLPYAAKLDHEFEDQADLAKPLIIAVDCPSGLDCDTGALDDHALYADETVTFGAAKYGLLAFPGAEAVGDLYVADIGLSPKLKELSSLKTDLVDGATVKSLLPRRPMNAHKGTFGKAFLVTGSVNYIGAGYLAASAAYRVGAGLVTVGVPQMILSTLAGMIPEATWVLLPNDMGMVNKSAAKVVREESAGYDALLVGCGIGNEDETRDFMAALLQPEVSLPKTAPRKLGLLQSILSDEQAEGDKADHHLPPLVIDADGLNALAKLDDWHKLLPPNTILTPHPREFARLAKLKSSDEVQAKRIELAREKAKAWKAIVVLKGAFTVIAAPDGHVTVSPFASARLATAGTGDVLAGVIAGLLAQGLKPYEAAVAGVWLHGCAGTTAAVTYSGSLASNVALHLSEVMEHL